MSLVTSSERAVCLPNSNDPKDNMSSTSDSPGTAKKPTVLITTVRSDEPEVTRRELWSYYLYYFGNNGVGPFVYTLTLFQSLATSAGYDPYLGPGSSCTASTKCVLPWMGGTKSIASLVLIANGISYTIMAAIFTTVGSAADYATFGRWLLLAVTVICWAGQYACMALTSPSTWKLAMGLYSIGLFSWNSVLVFYAAVFPRLARNTPHCRTLRQRYGKGEMSIEEFEREESLEKNRISNMSTVYGNIGFVLAYVLNLALLLAPKTANDPKVDNYIIAFDVSLWVIFGIWWFIYQLPRPGPPLPKGTSYLTVGWKQIWATLKTCRQLPYTFVYLFAFFLLADGFNTTTTLVFICQNDKFNFSFLQTTYLGLCLAVSACIGTFGFWCVQRHWKISTKKMFAVTNVVTILVPLWGMIGIWTQKIGFHNAWEFWAFNIVFGLFQAPYFPFSQTMVAELCPPGFDNMFFALFGFVNTAASVLGPNVVQAIIERTGSDWYGFPFLFAISATASLVIWFGVDVAQGRRDAVRWATARRGQVADGFDAM